MDPSQFMLYPDTKFTNTIHEKIQLNGTLTNNIGTVVLDSTNNLMSLPVTKLKTLTGSLTINNNDPVANQVLVANGSGLANWTTLIDNGIISLNAVSNTVQSFSTTNTGTDFTITSDNGTGVHSFNLPDASATARGLITTGTQTIAGAKTFSTSVSTPTITSSGALSISSGTNQDITIDSGGTGRILINTIQSRGVIFGVDDTPTSVTDQIVVASAGNLTRNGLVMGVCSMPGGGTPFYNPFIGAQVPSSAWKPFFINNGTAGVVFGGNIQLNPVTEYAAGTSYSNVFCGNSNLHSGANLYVSGSLFCDSSRNLTLGAGNITTTGTITASNIPTTILNSVVVHVQSDGSIFYQAGARTVSISKGATGVYVLSLSSSALIRSCVCTSTLSGGARIMTAEVNGTNSCTVVCRTVAEAGNDAPFNAHITWT